MSYDSETQILSEFRTNLITFLDELIVQFPTEPDFIIARLFVKDKLSCEVMINTFIRECHPHKQWILEKNDKFFLENDLNIFSAVGKGKVNHFKVLWKSSNLTNEDRNVMWDWFKTFLFLSEQYQKLKSQN